MNIRPYSLLSLAALSLSLALPLSAASYDGPVAARISSVHVISNGGIKIERGSSVGDVFFAMKYKNREELAANVWVFHDFQADTDSRAYGACRSVVVTFDHNRVVDLRLVNRAGVTAIAADLKASPTAGSLAAK
jgi:hypothetical protein